jgi:hypothetical protein
LRVKESKYWLDEPAGDMLLFCSLAGAIWRMQSIREDLPTI